MSSNQHGGDARERELLELCVGLRNYLQGFPRRSPPTEHDRGYVETTLTDIGRLAGDANLNAQVAQARVSSEPLFYAQRWAVMSTFRSGDHAWSAEIDHLAANGVQRSEVTAIRKWSTKHIARRRNHPSFRDRPHPLASPYPLAEAARELTSLLDDLFAGLGNTASYRYVRGQRIERPATLSGAQAQKVRAAVDQMRGYLAVIVVLLVNRREFLPEFSLSYTLAVGGYCATSAAR